MEMLLLKVFIMIYISRIFSQLISMEQAIIMWNNIQTSPSSRRLIKQSEIGTLHDSRSSVRPISRTICIDLTQQRKVRVKLGKLSSF